MLRERTPSTIIQKGDIFDCNDLNGHLLQPGTPLGVTCAALCPPGKKLLLHSICKNATFLFASSLPAKRCKRTPIPPDDGLRGLIGPSIICRKSCLFCS